MTLFQKLRNKIVCNKHILISNFLTQEFNVAQAGLVLHSLLLSPPNAEGIRVHCHIWLYDCLLCVFECVFSVILTYFPRHSVCSLSVCIYSNKSSLWKAVSLKKAKWEFNLCVCKNNRWIHILETMSPQSLALSILLYPLYTTVVILKIGATPSIWGKSLWVGFYIVTLN